MAIAARSLLLVSATAALSDIAWGYGGGARSHSELVKGNILLHTLSPLEVQSQVGNIELSSDSNARHKQVRQDGRIPFSANITALLVIG